MGVHKYFSSRKIYIKRDSVGGAVIRNLGTAPRWKNNSLHTLTFDYSRVQNPSVFLNFLQTFCLLKTTHSFYIYILFRSLEIYFCSVCASLPYSSNLRSFLLNYHNLFSSFFSLSLLFFLIPPLLILFFASSSYKMHITTKIYLHFLFENTDGRIVLYTSLYFPVFFVQL